MRWQVREWQLDSRTRDVTGPGGIEQLRPRVYRTFRLLVERAPAVVSKDELLDAVWGARAVTDGAIAQVIRELRAILGDDPSEPRIIATRHRQGYQCIAPVARINGDDDGGEPATIAGSVDTESAASPEPAASMEPAPPAPVSSHGARRWWSLGAAAVLAGGLFLGIALWPDETAEEPATTSGWPNEQRAAADLAAGLRAAHLLQSADALRYLEAAAAVEDTPRLQAQRARMLLRLGRRAEADALVRRSAALAPSLSRTDQLLTEAVGHEIAGQLAAAGKIYSVLAAMFPDDTDYALARIETTPSPELEIASEWLEHPEIPAARRLLLSARAAGLANDPEALRSKAESTLLASGEAAPVIAALARHQLAMALTALGETESGRQESLTAIDALLALGEQRSAFTAWSYALGQAEDPATLEELLATYAGTLGKSDDPLHRAELSFTRGRLEVLRRDYSAALQHFELAASRSADLNPMRLLIARRFQAGALMRLGEIEQAQKVLLDAIRIAESRGTPRILGTFFNTLANVASYRGEPDLAVQHYERALVEYRQSGSVAKQLLVLSNLVSAYVSQGKFEKALARSEHGLEQARELGDMVRVSSLLLTRAWCHEALGDLKTSQTLASEGIAASREVGHTTREVLLLLLQSHIGRHRAELAEAEAAWRRASELQVDTAQVLMEINLARANLDRELGQPARARARLAQFRRDHPEVSDGSHTADQTLMEANLDLDEGLAARAEQNLRELLDTAGRGGNVLVERDAHTRLGLALAMQGKAAAAAEQLDVAKELVARAPELRARLELAFAQARLEHLVAGQPALLERLSRDRETSLTDLDDGRGRLRWAIETAAAAGFRLQALEARVELLSYGTGTAEEAASLARELDQRRLLRLRKRLTRLVSSWKDLERRERASALPG